MAKEMIESEAPLPAAVATTSDLEQFCGLLAEQGLHAALAFLNARTPHRFTGVFRFDGETLRSVALVDKWDGEVRRGEDVPLSEAYCAVLHDGADVLEVLDGPADERYPHMQASPVASYCGAVIRDADGEPWGALCHYDVQPCQVKSSDLPLLAAAGEVVWNHLAQR
ncbi:MAG TPA: GAF domain-containing protein [Ramlibacter sp.]|jgi:GAF domain-containing protein|nr:GAF domain-containing protein [Ramlibacter sp.]